MLVKFDFNVPQENMQDRSVTAMLTIEAEVINAGLANEIVFIRNVTGNGTVVLWNLVGSSGMHVQVQDLASHHAYLVLREMSQRVEAGLKAKQSRNGHQNVVHVAEEVLS